MSPTTNDLLTLPPTVLISGYRGLAESFIREFLGHGARVSVLVRNSTVVDSLREKFPTVHFHSGEVQNETTVKEWVKSAHEKFHSIDVVINNAAITGPVGRLHEISLAEFESTLQTNLLGPVSLLQQVIPIMLKQRKGVCLNLSGGGATSARPRVSAYAVSKCALVRLTENLALEYPELNFYAISPGLLKTNMIKDLLDRGAGPLGDEFAFLEKKSAEGGEDPIRAAKLAYWLTQHRPKNLNGKVISAVHDWDGKNEVLNLKKGASWWTLRRMDSLAATELTEGPTA